MTDVLRPRAEEERDPEEQPDHVELGSASDTYEGAALALREYAESHHDAHGLPGTDEAHADDVVEVPEGAGLFTRLKASLASYATLRHTPYGLGPALTLGAISFFQRFDTQAFYVAGPDIVADLEIEIGDLVMLLTYTSVILVFGGIAAGWLADRVRRVPFVTIGTVLSGIFSVTAGWATRLLTLGSARVADQVADEGASVPRFSLLADYYPPEARGRTFAMISSLARAGEILAIVLVGIAIQVWGWRTGLIMFGLPLVFVGFISMFTLREPVRGYMERKALGADEATARTEDDPQSFGEAWRATWAVRTLRRLFMGSIFTNAGNVVFGFYVPFYLAEEYGLNAAERSLILLPIVVGGLAGGVVGGNMVDRLIRRNPARVLVVLAGFALVAAVGPLGFALKPPIWVLIAFYTVWGFGAAMVGPAESVVYAQVVPASIRTQGLQMTAMALLPATIIVLPLGQAVFGEYGYQNVFLFSSPFLVIGALIQLTAGGFFELDARSAFAQNLASEEWRRAKAAGRGKLLVCRDVDVAYDGVQVLFGVDFDVEEGEIIALLGTNGAGKSTLLRAISGITEASGGAIVFDGRDITHMPPHEIAHRGVVHMPGGRGIFPGLSVMDNLILAMFGVDDPAEINRKLTEVFEIFPRLRERSDAEAQLLSGGEQQQLSLAQAFLAEPRLLCIDELSLGLSPVVVGELLEIVKEIHRRGVTIVVVEQSVNVALALAEKAIFMEKGEVRFFGRTEDLRQRPDILRAVYVKGTGALTTGPSGARRSRREERELALAEARVVLEAKELSKTFGGIRAVNDVSLELRDGEILGLIGPNGAGKTTLFELLSGHQVADAGRVVFDGVDVTGEGPEKRARRGLVRRFQDARLFPSLTVFETLMVALEQHYEVRSSLLNAAGVPRARRAERRVRERAEELVALLELGAYRDKFVKELSTGLRRIVDLACVLAAEPRVLLLDEPSSGIAQAETESLGPLLRRVQFESGCSILVIEHDMTLISRLSDELVAMDQGAVVVRGKPDVVLEDERVIEAYLGREEVAVRRSGDR